jgi:hypothetical protein
MANRDMKYDNTIASNYEQSQLGGCLGYVNLEGIAKLQLFSEEYEQLGAVKLNVGLKAEAKELNSRIPTEYH